MVRRVSQSQRLRNVLFLLWKEKFKKKEYEKGFESFYQEKMEIIINSLKNKL